MAMDHIQVPTSCFMKTPKSKRMYKMGKVRVKPEVKIGTYQAMKLVKRRSCTPQTSVDFGQGKYC